MPLKKSSSVLFRSIFGVFVVVLLCIPLLGKRQETPSARESVSTSGAELPEQLLRSGGPYVKEESLVPRALEFAQSRGVTDMRVTAVLFATYGEAVRRNPMAAGTSLHSEREVYVVEIEGEITILRGDRAAGPYRRSYYVYDAALGDLIAWGATDEEPVID